MEDKIKTTPVKRQYIDDVPIIKTSDSPQSGQVIKTSSPSQAQDSVKRPIIQTTPLSRVPVEDRRDPAEIRRTEHAQASYVRPKDRPTPREAHVPGLKTTIGDVLADKLDVQLSGGEEEKAKKALETAALAGVKHPEAVKRRGEIIRSRRWKFLSHMGHARRALARARGLWNIEDIMSCVQKVNHHLEQASELDEDRRTPVELRSLIGTSKRELEGLPDQFYTTMTAVPVDVKTLEAMRSDGDDTPIAAIASFEMRESREWPEGTVCRVVRDHDQHPFTFRVTGVYTTDGKHWISCKNDVSVVRCCTPFAMPEAGPPIPELTPGQSIPQPVKILYSHGMEYGSEPYLYLQDDRHRFECKVGERAILFMGHDQHALMQKGRFGQGWIYHAYSKDMCVVYINRMVGSSSRGFCTLLEERPSQTTEPLFVMTVEYGSLRLATAWVQEGSHVRRIELNWDQEFTRGDDYIVLLERCFGPITTFLPVRQPIGEAKLTIN